LVPAVKELAIRVARRLPMIAPEPPRGYKYPVTFRVDPDAADGVRPIGAADETPVAAAPMPIVIPMADLTDVSVPTV
jgi:hypothetical protein